MVVLKMWSETSSISITKDLVRNTDSQVPPRTAGTEKLQMGSRNLGLTSSLGHFDAQPYSDRIVLFFQNVLICSTPLAFHHNPGILAGKGKAVALSPFCRWQGKDYRDYMTG